MEKVDNPAQLALTDMTWVVQVARALLHDDAAADDVAQDAWLIAAHRAPRDGRPVRPWLSRVVLNLVRMRARGEKRRATREQRSGETVQPLPTPAELIERIETQRAVAGEVLALAEPYRSTVLLHYVEGLSSAEIARRLGIPDGTVRRRLKVALDEIRDRLCARDDGPKGGWLAALAPLCGLPGRKTPPKSWLLPAAVFALGVGAIALLVLLARRDVPPPVSDRGAPPVVQNSAHDAPVAAGVLGALVQPEVAPRRVAGTVMFDGKPVDHATVRLAAIVPNGPPLPVGERTTAADGAFDFGMQPAATFTVSAQVASRTGASARVDVADPRATADPVVLLLDGCTSRLFGKIRDASGGPVAAARVSFEGGAAVADRAGMYSLCVPAGTRVRVEADGYGVLSIPTYAPGEVHHDIVMVPESTVSGTIVDEANHPVPGALVTVTPEGPDGGINPFALASNLATSDAAGRFVVDRLGPGMFRVAAVAEGFASPSPARVFTRPGRPADLHVVVAGRVRVHGKVVVAGKPVAGARVRLVDPQLRASNLVAQGLASFSQPDGTFVLESARGHFDVVADPYDVASPAQLAVDGPTDATIEVTPRASVRGRVTRHGMPVANAEIHCMRPPSTNMTTKTDASGEFAFEGLLPGDTMLWGQSLAIGAFGSRTFTVTEGQQMSADVELDGGARVSGTVIDAAKRPVPGVFVRLVAPTGDEGWCMTDARGAFECSSMAGGADYTAGVHPSPDAGHPFVSETRTVHLRDGDDVVTGLEIPIQLEALAIRGRVLDDTGAPVADCHVMAAGGMRAPSTIDNIAFLSPWTRTAVDGSFQIANLAHGPHVVAVACPDGALGERFDVMPGGASIDIAIARAGTITGRVAGFTTSPIVHTERITPGTIMGYVAIRDGDRFTLHGIPPGRYPVEALAGTQTDAQLVDLRPGATADLTLTARPTTTISGRVVELGTRKPVAGMPCETRVSADGFAGTLQPMPRSKVTDDTGQFSVTAPVGRVRVLCGGPGPFSAAGGDVDVTASGAHDVEVIAVRATADPSDAGFALRPWRLPATVFAIRPDGPAAGSGLAVGDQLAAIDNVPVSGLVPDAVQRLLANHPAGTPVRLTVERSGASVIVEVVPRAANTPPPP